jgi:hypothetical protein
VVTAIVVPLAPVQIGIDENGLGPRLGPMVVTAVRIEIDAAKLSNRRALARATSRAGIGDSKAECAHGEMGDAEGLVLAVLETHLDLRPTSFAQLHSNLSLDDDASLRRDCPDGAAPHACWNDPVALPAFGPGPSESQRRAARRLRDDGVSLRTVRAGIVCAKRMNVGRARGVSRFDLDLELMVRLGQRLRGPRDAAPVLALCGKVGGRNQYAHALERLSPLVGVLEEGRARSGYAIPGFGEVHFVMDGDASEPAISLASMIGKYLRELWMHRINRYWNDAVPGTSPVSGYHEPQTEKFVSLTALTRRERNVPDECFER